MDTLHDVSDCVIKIKLSKKDNSLFKFPTKYIVSNETDMTSDLMIMVQKMVNNKFKNYLCEWASAHHDNFMSDTITYKSYKEMKITDSLDGLYCLTRGRFRLKVLYNNRRSGGVIDFPKYVLSSDWVYFYVKTKEIMLNRYYRKN